MKRNKIIPIALIVAMLAAIPLTTAFAATGTGTASASVIGTGNIQTIAFDTDPVTLITTVLVTLDDGTGVLQKVRISMETAISLGLVIPNATMITGPVTLIDPADLVTVLVDGTITGLVFVTDPVTLVTSLTVSWTDLALVPQETILDMELALELGLIVTDETKLTTAVVIDPTLILESSTYEKDVTMLGSFFGTALGLSLDQLAAYQEEFGSGVLAQALWMTADLGGDAALLDQILAAKSSGDFSTLVLPDGSTPTNWGQLRKVALASPHHNLGSVVSGHADPLGTSTITTTEPASTTQGNGNGHGHGHGKGK